MDVGHIPPDILDTVSLIRIVDDPDDEWHISFIKMFYYRWYSVDIYTVYYIICRAETMNPSGSIKIVYIEYKNSSFQSQ